MEDTKIFVAELAEHVREYDSRNYEKKAVNAEENEQEAIKMIESGEISGFQHYLYKSIDNSITMAQKENAERLLRKLTA